MDLLFLCTVLRLVLLNSVSLVLVGLAFLPAVSQISMATSLILAAFFILIIQTSRTSWTLFSGMAILALASQSLTQSTLGLSQSMVLMSSIFAVILFLNSGVTLFVSYFCTTLFFNTTLLLSASALVNAKVILLLHVLNFMFAYALSITSRLGVVLLILAAVISKTLLQLGCILTSVDTQIAASEMLIFAVLAASLVKSAYFGYLPILATGNLVLVQVLATATNLQQEFVLVSMGIYAMLFALLLLSSGEQSSSQLVLITAIYAGFPLTGWSVLKFISLATTQALSALGVLLYLFAILAVLLSALRVTRAAGTCDSRSFFPILVLV